MIRKKKFVMLKNVPFKYVIFLFFISSLIISCATSTNNEPSTKQEKKQTITLLFGGDIMAHKPNFNMKDFSSIWEGIKDTVQNADLSFANIEAPVAESLPYSSFPNFNMHAEYPEEAINAGFSVFSLVNNHVNDQGLDGINQTLEWSKKAEQKYKSQGIELYFSGLREYKDAPFSYKLIKKDDWTILFCAVTEILNRPTFKQYINYVPKTNKGWEDFIKYLTVLREENPCDLFVLSLHSDEPEYIFEVEEDRRAYYKQLSNIVDVIWTNHPHIAREKEFIANKTTQKLEKVIIYGNGNLISGQRWEPDFKNPTNPRDDTGDGYLLEVTFEKSTLEPKPVIKDYQTHFITTYINSAWGFVIKPLNDEFIHYLKESGRPVWAEYLKKRKEITEKTKETITWQ